jgi:hypothetical protein
MKAVAILADPKAKRVAYESRRAPQPRFAFIAPLQLHVMPKRIGKSVEGLWCFLSGDIGSAVMQTGGVVVLDSQRIHGGDVAMAYAGTYTYVDRTLQAEVEAFLYNPAFSGQFDVFGEPTGPVRKTTLVGDLTEDGFIVGEISRGHVTLPMVLQKLRDLA